MTRKHKLAIVLAMLVMAGAVAACGKGAPTPSAASPAAPAAPSSVASSPNAQQSPLAPSPTGFSGDRAFDFVAKQVAFGPRPPDTDSIRKTQDYIIGQLKGFGCKVDTDDFHANTPKGRLAMKNILVKIPGASPSIILLGTHYDTDTLHANDDQKMSNFVGADDAGSSTGVMMEIARVLCGKPSPEIKPAATVWIAFFDGEEALQHWSDTDSCYGSRQMAAKLAASGELARVKAFVLADIVGYKNLHINPEANSASWLVDIVWNKAAQLGHSDSFVAEKVGGIEDDHLAFVHRNVPSLDIIGDVWRLYWHTPQDTLDKISPRSLQAVGEVILASLPEIARRIH
ncbi:MAG: M28 family peptidase [Candidatus Acidiferrales bacterium]